MPQSKGCRNCAKLIEIRESETVPGEFLITCADCSYTELGPFDNDSVDAPCDDWEVVE